MSDDEIVEVAWSRDRPRGLIGQRYSLQHHMRSGASTTLCGIRIPWIHVVAGDSQRCRRCDALALSAEGSRER